MELLSVLSTVCFVAGLLIILVGILVKRSYDTDHPHRGTCVVKVGVALLLLSFLLGLPDLLRGYKNGVMTPATTHQGHP